MRSLLGRPVAAALLLVALAYAATLFALEKRAFFVIDNANKFLQVQAVLASHYRDFSLAWPGRTLDPEYRWNPLPHPFSTVEHGRLFCFYPPAFAAISALPYRWLGMPGLYALPWLASLGLLAGVARVARTLGADARGRAAAVLITGLCTPVWFYSVVFWEHVPATCLAVWGAEGVLRFLRDGVRRALVRGCALGALAVYLRDDLYLFCGLLAAVATGFAPPGRRLAAAATALATLALAILPLWAFQAWALGHPFGFHLDSQLGPDLASHLRERDEVLHVLFLASLAGRPASLLAMGPVAVALAVAPRLGAARAAWLPPTLAGYAALACALSLAGYATAESPIVWMMATNGLLASVPILAFAGFRFAGPDEAPLEPRLTAALRAVALGHAALYALLAPLVATGGIHWGNRFLLVLYPLLAVQAGPNLVRWLERYARGRVHAVGAIALAALLSFGAQAWSIRLLDAKQSFSVRLAEEVARHPGLPIATGLFWLPMELFGEFGTRPLFLVRSQADLRELSARLHRAGHRELLFATAPGGANTGTLVGRVDDPVLRFYGVDLVRIETR